jgi:hypothetical protein
VRGNEKQKEKKEKETFRQRDWHCTNIAAGSVIGIAPTLQLAA